jgi:TonB family protein
VLNSEARAEVTPERKSAAVRVAAVVAILAIVGLGVYWFMSRSNTDASVTETASTAAATVGAQPAVPPAQLPPPASAESNDHAPPTRAPHNHSRSGGAEPGLPSAVLHEEIPTVPLSARQTIHGRVKVTVRVTVDKSGTVVSDVLENPGPSKYFARIAGAAASKWKFVPAADGHASRQWLVQFEFSRDGTKAHAVTRN